MNVERIRQLADIIEKQPHTTVDAPSGFHMEAVLHECRTPCCIAGWANHTFGGRESATTYDAAKHLGISEDERERLFFARGTRLSFDAITPAHAAAVLRNLADTGTVDWSVGAPKAE